MKNIFFTTVVLAAVTLISGSAFAESMEYGEPTYQGQHSRRDVAHSGCQPYDAYADEQTSAIDLYCRGYACVNAGMANDMAGVKLLNISSLRGFFPPPHLNSAQICASRQEPGDNWEQ